MLISYLMLHCLDGYIIPYGSTVWLLKNYCPSPAGGPVVMTMTFTF